MVEGWHDRPFPSWMRRGRGRPKSPAAKQQISVRLDPDVLATLRAAGPGWQSRINDLLRQALRIRKPPAKRAAAAPNAAAPPAVIRRPRI